MLPRCSVAALALPPVVGALIVCQTPAHSLRPEAAGGAYFIYPAFSHTPPPASHANVIDPVSMIPVAEREKYAPLHSAFLIIEILHPRLTILSPH